MALKYRFLEPCMNTRGRAYHYSLTENNNQLKNSHRAASVQYLDSLKARKYKCSRSAPSH